MRYAVRVCGGWMVLAVTVGIVVALLGGVRVSGQTAIQELRKAELGRAVFNDEDVSADGSVSCATCHVASKNYTDGRRVAVGIKRIAVLDGQRVLVPGIGTRNTPSLPFKAGDDLQFADGRTIGVNRQALQPLTNPLEMGNDSVQDVIRRLRPRYQRSFSRVYRDGFTAQTMADAIAHFERKIAPRDAPFQRYDAGYQFAMGDSASRGYVIFKRDCATCHVPPLLSDRRFHNTGVTWATETNATLRTNQERNDALGRFAILDPSLRKQTDIRAFKTANLWDVAKTAPYTHAGRIATLAGVVDRYADGWRNVAGQLDPFRDGRAGPFNYDQGERSDLLAFLIEGTRSRSFPNFAER